MRLSELLGREVRDADNQYVGTVADVVLVQDGPLRGPYAASLRVSGLILVERRHVRLLGYERDVLPAALGWLLTRLAGRISYVPWDTVTLDEKDVTLSVRMADLADHDPAYRRRTT